MGQLNHNPVGKAYIGKQDKELIHNPKAAG